jgi:hypothetical protein
VGEEECAQKDSGVDDGDAYICERPANTIAAGIWRVSKSVSSDVRFGRERYPTQLIERLCVAERTHMNDTGGDGWDTHCHDSEGLSGKGGTR